MPVIGFVADSIDDVEPEWTPLLTVNDEPTGVDVSLRLIPSHIFKKELRSVYVKNKHKSEKDQQKAADEWEMDLLVRCFAESKGWSSRIVGPAIQRYQVFIPSAKPGEVLLDGHWDDGLKRMYLKDDPAAMGMLKHTYDKFRESKYVAEKADEEGKDEPSLDGSDSGSE